MVKEPVWSKMDERTS